MNEATVEEAIERTKALVASYPEDQKQDALLGVLRGVIQCHEVGDITDPEVFLSTMSRLGSLCLNVSNDGMSLFHVLDKDMDKILSPLGRAHTEFYRAVSTINNLLDRLREKEGLKAGGDVRPTLRLWNEMFMEARRGLARIDEFRRELTALGED